MSCSQMSIIKFNMTKKQGLRHSTKKTIVTFFNVKRTTKDQKSQSEFSDGLVRMCSKEYYPTIFMSSDESIQTKLKVYTKKDYANATAIDRLMTPIETKSYNSTKIF